MLRSTAVLVARRLPRSRGGQSPARLLPAYLQSTSPLKSTRRSYAVVQGASVPSSRKVWDSVEEAIQDVKSGDVLLSGGTYMLSIVLYKQLTLSCCFTQVLVCVEHQVRIFARVPSMPEDQGPYRYSNQCTGSEERRPGFDSYLKQRRIWRTRPRYDTVTSEIDGVAERDRHR